MPPQVSRYPTRTKKRPGYLDDYDCSGLALTNSMATLVLFACEPSGFTEASKEEVWIKAMNEEISMIEKNKHGNWTCRLS